MVHRQDANLQNNVYLAVYLSRSPDEVEKACGKEHHGLIKALKQEAGWPYDLGDDPSFFSLTTWGGHLTWGVCRRPVRNSLNPGDVVVFFSVRRNDREAPYDYRLCAIATVERKVSQKEVWCCPSLKTYRQYLNLLIKPDEPGWVHYEPATARKYWHDDWLWRLVDDGQFRKKDLDVYDKQDRASEGAPIPGCLLEFAQNYVIFSSAPDETRVLAKPPLLARCERNGTHETWCRDTLSQAVKRHTLGKAKKHSNSREFLRINNQQAHPHIRWTMDASKLTKWRAQFFRLLSRAGCRRRRKRMPGLTK